MATPVKTGSRDLFSFPAYRPPPTFSDATRQLCAGAYLDPKFANAVIREVAEDEHRAVPPSFGFDLAPVVRHCFRARRRQLPRDLVLSLLVLIGLVFATLPTVAWLAVGFLILTLRSAWLRQLPVQTRVYVIGGLGLVALCSCLGSLVLAGLAVLLPQLTSTQATDMYGNPVSTGSSVDSSLPLVWAGVPVALAVLTFAWMYVIRHGTYAILATELASGAPPELPALGSERIANRVAVVANAQRGNMTVQETDPFVGAGKVRQGWSLAVPLRPAKGTAAPETVDLDPVVLNARIRRAVLALRDESLPENARVPGLYLVPHVVADGERAKGDPLLDPALGVPYAYASEEAIEAVLRHPQGGLRYYERMVIGASGKAVRTGDGQPVLPAQSLGIDVTAFVHVAVEGGMLYAEYMATVMPPIRRLYQLVDRLRSDRITGRALLDTLRELPADTAASGARAARTLWQIVTTSWRLERARLAREEFRVYDYGARASVRELGAEPESYKFLQQLDERKYAKLLSRTVGEAIVEYLAENGVDTSEFRATLGHVQNFYSTVNNISGGQVAFGNDNVFQQQPPAGGTA